MCRDALLNSAKRRIGVLDDTDWPWNEVELGVTCGVDLRVSFFFNVARNGPPKKRVPLFGAIHQYRYPRG